MDVTFHITKLTAACCRNVWDMSRPTENKTTFSLFNGMLWTIQR